MHHHDEVRHLTQVQENAQHSSEVANNIANERTVNEAASRRTQVDLTANLVSDECNYNYTYAGIKLPLHKKMDTSSHNLDFAIETIELISIQLILVIM